MRILKTKFLFLIFVGSIYSQSGSYPPPTNLITIPTAGSLSRGCFSVDMRLQKEGGLTVGLAAGITDRFQFGVSYGASRLIGDSSFVWYPRPEANIKYRLINETISGPGIAIGLDTQGFGKYNPEDLLGGDTLKFDRYDIKAFGAFVSVSKNWMTFLGNLGLHGGMNYNFTETKDGDKDPNLFFGMDMEFNPELSLLIEYNAAFNENSEENNTIAVDTGYLNTAIRWTFVEHLHIELDFNNLLLNDNKVKYFNRELKIIYIEYF